MQFTLRRIAPVAGVLGGLAGGVFAREMLNIGSARDRWLPALRNHPVLWALGCGIVVSVLGAVTHLTWGTGYSPARAIIDGGNAPYWFGPAKFLSTLPWPRFPNDPSAAVVLLGMVAYFSGGVRATLAAVIMIVEATASRGLIMPLFLSALIAHATSALVCKERLYHGLSKPWRASLKESPATAAPGAGSDLSGLRQKSRLAALYGYKTEICPWRYRSLSFGRGTGLVHQRFQISVCSGGKHCGDTQTGRRADRAGSTGPPTRH